MKNRYQDLLMSSCLMLVCVMTTGYAQKLPNKQKQSLWTSNLKVDGKLGEVNKNFQAYNTAIEAFYTLSNDSANLYLTVRSGHEAILKRMLNGGVTLTVKPSNNQEAPGVAVGYPFYESNLNRMSVTNWVLSDNRMVRPEGRELDSLVNVNNERIGKKAKFIRVDGIASVDTLLSVYNDDAIKAAGGFDGQLNYVYELALPLKYLWSVIKPDQKFAYQVKINEVKEQNITVNFDKDGNFKSMFKGAGAVGGQEPTDFWGQYTLARSPRLN